MADLLDSLQRQLRERLDELRPLVAEYERLRAAEQALGEGAPSPSRRRRGQGQSGARRRGRGSSKGRRTNTPAERRANRDRVLAIVTERPGITKAELKQAAGLSSAGVAQNLRRLVDTGQMVEEPLPSGDMGYRVGPG